MFSTAMEEVIIKKNSVMDEMCTLNAFLLVGWFGGVSCATVTGEKILLRLDSTSSGQMDRFQRALSLHTKGHVSEALAEYERILSNFNEASIDAPMHVVLHNMGTIHFSQGHSDRALELVEHALTLDSANANYHNTRANMLQALSKVDASLEAYMTVFGLTKDDLVACLNLAHILTNTLGPQVDPQSSYELWEHIHVHAVTIYEQACELMRQRERHRVLVLSQVEASGSGAVESRDPVEIAQEVTALNELAITYQKLGNTMPALRALNRAVGLAPHDLQSVGNLANALKDIGDLDGAIEMGLRGIQIAPTSALINYNLGLVYQSTLQMDEAAFHWREALRKQPDLLPALASLGHYEGHKGNMTGARHYYSLGLLKAQNSHDLDPLRLQNATACIPHIYESNKHILSVRKDFIESLTRLLPQSHTLRRCPLDAATNTRQCFDVDEAVDEDESSFLKLGDPLTTIGSGGLGYYLIYTGHNDVHVRRLHASVYWESCQSLHFTAPFLLKESPLAHPVHRRGQRLKIGFISSHFFHHSVGLLTQGVIRGLDPSKFEKILIHPPREFKDDVTEAITTAVERVVVVPQSLLVAQRMIASEELDVLVYCEIGMDRLNYFLSFARLARRSAFFWGHAITSGVSIIDDPRVKDLPREQKLQIGGGVDYFISSELFEGPNAQERYTESLYQMKSLTTSFQRPPPPQTSMALREMLHEEYQDSLQADSHVYLIPQTLYKLHPDFDKLAQGVLQSDPMGVIVMPTAQNSEWTEQILQRMARELGDTLVRRVLISRRLSFDEFNRFVQLAHVVLDPFPVGGGRSSFEIFAVGTPIVMLYNRTSILQLTYGMYKTMGIEDGITFSEKDYVHKAVEIGTNPAYRQALRERILANNHKLYERQDVVNEWDTFLHTIVNTPRPAGEWVEGSGTSQSTPKGHDAVEWQFDSTFSQEEIERQRGEWLDLNVKEDTVSFVQRNGDRVEFVYDDRPTKKVTEGSQTLGWHWSRRSFGWEVEPGDAELGSESPNERASNLRYAVKLSHEDTVSQQMGSYLIEVWEWSDPVAVADNFSNHIHAEPVKRAWITEVLRRGSQHTQEVAWVLPIRFLTESTLVTHWSTFSDFDSHRAIDPKACGGTDWIRACLNIHVGDDLAQRMSWFAYRYAFSPDVVEWLTRRAKSLTPEHSSPKWLNTRNPQPLPQPARSPTPALTIGITSCKRLDLFQHTADALLASIRSYFNPSSPHCQAELFQNGSLDDLPFVICRILVIDDASEHLDRATMLAKYPDFEFLFKPKHRRGHADSMNLMLSTVKTRYFMYLEDDWYCGRLETRVNRLGRYSSMTSLPGIVHMLEQVNVHHRSLAQLVGDGMFDLLPLHEFGTTDPAHSFTYWPGFSLNPAVWDLSVFAADGFNYWFHVNDSRFEQSFSLAMFKRGLKVAYLPKLTFEHIGTEVSAYQLSGSPRPWESNPSR